ncbi:MAG: hypothetical protein KA104_01015 [Candidatus Pacebacteria bacterium]|nr:hypothetical protein [Candidatus Paceibacterota bacterium]
MRIDIVGAPASGKSTLAAAIAKKLSIPHIHLDRFWFESGGRQSKQVTPNIEQVRAKIREKTLEAIKAEAWVSDGTYLHVQNEVVSRADVLIFLDIPLGYRVLNHAKRAFLKPKMHKEVSAWDDITFFIELIRRAYTSGSKLRNFVNEHTDKAVILRSNKEINNYLNGLLTPRRR